MNKLMPYVRHRWVLTWSNMLCNAHAEYLCTYTQLWGCRTVIVFAVAIITVCIGATVCVGPTVPVRSTVCVTV